MQHFLHVSHFSCFVVQVPAFAKILNDSATDGILSSNNFDLCLVSSPKITWDIEGGLECGRVTMS